MSLFQVHRDLLGREASAEIYERAVALRSAFEQSRVARRGVDPRTRVSRVVYADRLGDLAGGLEAAIRDRIDEAVAGLGITPFETAWFEVQLTSHNDGDFFRNHTDNASPETAGRTLTFVYYFHAEPARFSGGELVFTGADGDEVCVTPSNDTLILFDPRTSHEVRRISCPSGRFEDGRFALTGWLHRPVPKPRQDDFFNDRIFTPIGRWVPSSAAAWPARRAVTSTRNRPLQPSADALLRLYGDLHRAGPTPDRVDVRPSLSGEEFLRDYYARNRPVLLPRVLGDSPAVRDWSPDHFAARFGDVSVQITAGRERSGDYEQRFRETVRTVTLADLARMLAATDESNDYYLVARNNFFENPKLHMLRDELRPPPDIVNDSDRRPGSAKLWIGPAGTVTPLHYDEHSILFTQVHGRKRFRLVPSFDRDYVYPRDKYYSDVDPEDVDPARHPLFARASVMEVEVGPGDGLFIPVGWWHWARSLSVSVSATFSSFAWPFANTRLLPGR
ncbi:cupin-like domain-containing protein [Nocardioides astragali]|uniref:Cupin-like domain-containing protein n=1 Tax=Nocardioides astragali TaxID=1776736 RepID=A0ABW2N0Y9_9ACTN|nr:cupin-like domain-containing protein [Nocardioides astragali]